MLATETVLAPYAPTAADTGAAAALIRALYDAYARRDVLDVMSALSPDVVIRQTAELPWGGTYEGREAAGRFYLTLLSHVESRVEVQEVVAAGDRVVVMGRTRGIVRATGLAFDVRAVHVYEVRGGKITRFEAYIDTPAMQAALAAA